MFLEFNCGHFGINKESLRPSWIAPYLKRGVAEKGLPTKLIVGIVFGESINAILSPGEEIISPHRVLGQALFK